MTPPRLTLPAVIADTQFFSGEVTVAMIRAAAVGFTVWNVTSFALPVFVALTIYLTWNRGTRCTLPMARAIIWTRIDSVKYNSYLVKTEIIGKNKAFWLIRYKFWFLCYTLEL